MVVCRFRGEMISTMEIKRKTVTPATAKKWLATMIDTNRHVKSRKIEQYAADMRSGRWQTGTGETLKFNTNGQLIDGQHRLQAVIAAGRTVVFDVAYEVPVEAMSVLDTGVPRSPADAMKISGITAPRQTALTSLVRSTVMWDHGNPMGWSGRGMFAPTHAMIIDRYRAEAAAFDTAAARGHDCQVAGLGSESLYGMAFYLFRRIGGESAEQVEGWFEQLITGANLHPWSPALTLRNRALKFKADRIKRAEQLAFNVIAWNYFREDRELRVLRLPNGGLANANFPTILGDDGRYAQTLLGDVVRRFDRSGRSTAA